MKKFVIYMMCAVAFLASCTEEVPVSKEHPIDIEVMPHEFDTLRVAFCNLSGASGSAIGSLQESLAGTDICLFAASASEEVKTAAAQWGHSVLVECEDAELVFVATAAEAYMSSVLTYSSSQALVVRTDDTCFLLGNLKTEDAQALLDSTLHVDESLNWIFHLTGAPDAETLYKAGFASILENALYAGSGVMSLMSEIKVIPVEGAAGDLVRYIYQEEIL